MGIVLPDLTNNINKIKKYLENHPVGETKTDASKVVEEQICCTQKEKHQK